jgi:replicative DNA helicase
MDKAGTAEKEKKCLYLVAEKGKWGIKDHVKRLNGVYNGAGWYIEAKYNAEVAHLCHEANMKYFEFPLLDESFDALKRRHRLEFFQEKAMETRTRIDGLKASLGIYNLDLNEYLSNEDNYKSLEKIADGQQLLDLVNKYDQLQEQIKRAEDEERIANINIKDTFAIQPYTLEDLQRELSQTKEGLKTGYTELDEMIRIPNKAITLVAGRPSHGKTTFMLNLFLNLIKQYPDQHFYFFSYEETCQQIALKVINILSGWIFNEAQNLIQLEGYLKAGSTNFDMVERGKNKYQELVTSGRLRITGEPYHVHQLGAIIANLKSKEPLGAVFIDYIQKIKNKQRFGTRQLELADTSSIILETAKRCSIPIILGAQLGRDKESKNKVKLDNLREAGDLEQDANLVLGLFNPAMEKAQDEQTQLTDRKVELKVTPLKNRNGIVNKTVSLDFDRPLLKISDKQKK